MPGPGAGPGLPDPIGTSLPAATGREASHRDPPRALLPGTHHFCHLGNFKAYLLVVGYVLQFVPIGGAVKVNPAAEVNEKRTALHKGGRRPQLFPGGRPQLYPTIHRRPCKSSPWKPGGVCPSWLFSLRLASSLILVIPCGDSFW